MTAQAIRNLVDAYGRQLGLDLAPHDLRRTHAQLARKGGCPLEQIQIGLGHSSIATTERYLGIRQDLSRGSGDYLDLNLEGL